MLILVAVDLFALATSSAIIRRNHAKALREQVATEMPEASQRERSASVAAKKIEVEVLHQRWQYEMWATHSWYMALVAFTVFGTCTSFGSSLVLNSEGCRVECGMCLKESSCNMRGEDCS